ncbi:MAG: hypothetical protein IKB87_04465 [Clostridia bacterium]|nr:hypothetical protein [Clostridia bacterium]
MRKVIALLLVAVLLIPAVSAYTGEQLNTADALNHLGLFLGTGTSYELDAELTRAQGITLLVRMLGKEAEAVSLPYTAPFTDVDEWAKPYVNYAWLHSITNGVSDVRYDPDGVMTDFMFLTLTLRALGYKDSGENPQFAWDNPYALAKSVGLADTEEANAAFKRANAVEVFWNALTADNNALANELIKNKVFSEDAFYKAVQIEKNGKDAEIVVPIIPWYPIVPPVTEPEETTTIPEETTTAPEEFEPGVYTYDDYLAMSSTERKEFKDQFGSTSAFLAWYNAAKKEYEDSQDRIEIGGDGEVNLGGGNG